MVQCNYAHCSGIFPFPGKKSIMPLISLVIVLVVVGVILWAINNYIPMQTNIKKILNLVVVIVVILWLLSVFGIIGNLTTLRVGK